MILRPLLIDADMDEEICAVHQMDANAVSDQLGHGGGSHRTSYLREVHSWSDLVILRAGVFNLHIVLVEGVADVD